jgi:hypothetical protein
MTILGDGHFGEPSSRHIFMPSCNWVREMNVGGAIMNFAKRSGSAQIGRPSAMETEENIRVLPHGNFAFRQVENGDDASVDDLRTLPGRVLGTSAVEIDHLIDELQTLRRKLQGDSERIQTDIAKYAALSEQVMQVTKIAFESVQKLPEAPSIGA